VINTVEHRNDCGVSNRVRRGERERRLELTRLGRDPKKRPPIPPAPRTACRTPKPSHASKQGSTRRRTCDTKSSAGAGFSSGLLSCVNTGSAFEREAFAHTTAAKSEAPYSGRTGPFIRASFDFRDFLLQAFSDTFSVPERFAKHMMIVADLKNGNADVIEDAFIAAWELQSGK
jgi:hypothetical protein